MAKHKLNYPYTWEERRPQLHEGVLFIPNHYDDHTHENLPPWEEIFGNRNPIHIEYCSGNGTWLTEKAKDKSINWIGVEKRLDRVQKIWSKKKRLGLDNLLIVCADANILIEHYLPSSYADKIYVNFPDPWPKLRHAKHRLFQQKFASHLSRTIKEEGELMVVTDDEPYSLQVADVMLQNPEWKEGFPTGYFVTDVPDYGSSYFEQLWKDKGRIIRYMKFIYQRLS